jgi:peptide/nickel transport system substrate-binding protein
MRFIACLLLFGFATTSCRLADAPARDSGTSESATETRPAVQRTLVMIAPALPASLASQPLGGTGTGSVGIIASTIFNAALATRDEDGRPVPFLAERLPELSTDSWRVFPDGSMETTYRLAPNLTWHSGHPLTADDFVFAWQVFATPEYGVATGLPIRMMQEVRAPDPRTVVIGWKQPYADANALETGNAGQLGGFPPLPRHLLEETHKQGVSLGASSPAFLANSPFWTVDYVGAGPYRLDAYTADASIDALAFDGHVLGRARIERVSIRPIGDANTALATILAGEGHFSANQLRGEPALILERQWGATGGKVQWVPRGDRLMFVQLRPERAQPRELATDVRVRRAIVHAIDKQPMFEAVTDNRGLLSDSFTKPHTQRYAEVERELPKLPYDPRRAEQLLQEAGFARGGDGRWDTPHGTPFELQVTYSVGAPQSEKEATILVSQLQTLGIDATVNAFNTRSQSAMERALLPGLVLGQSGRGEFGDGFLVFRSTDIPTAENRWFGINRGGYTSPEFDRLVDRYAQALDPKDIAQYTVQLEKLIRTDLPAIFLYYVSEAEAYDGRLRGIREARAGAMEPMRYIHEWYWDS